MDIALLGYGRMGRAVEERAGARGHRVVLRTTSEGPVREGVGDDGDASLGDADVAIDFSVGTAVPGHVERAAAAGVPLVVGATGWDDHMDEVEDLVEGAGIGLLFAPNFSLGAHLLFRLASVAGRLAGAVGGYDVHVVETHHRHKLDHPSGTARHLAELLVRAVPDKEGWSGGVVDPPDPSTLQVASVRAGEAAGVHVVGLDGADDRIELRHEARGRGGFARGALEAAEWLVGRTGFFTLDDMLNERFESAETL